MGTYKPVPQIRHSGNVTITEPKRSSQQNFKAWDYKNGCMQNCEGHKWLRY